MKRMKRNDLVSVLVTVLIIYNVSYMYVYTSNSKLTVGDVSDNEIPDDSDVKVGGFFSIYSICIFGVCSSKL